MRVPTFSRVLGTEPRFSWSSKLSLEVRHFSSPCVIFFRRNIIGFAFICIRTTMDGELPSINAYDQASLESSRDRKDVS